jgi:alcohol dehydrogenase
LSYAISGRFPVGKSLCSAVLLPFIMERLTAARPEKMARVAALLGEAGEGASVADAANSAVEGIRRQMAALKVPSRFREFNLSLDRLAAIAEAARNLEFTAFTPWTVSAEDVFEMLKQAF